ncbi:hypothetical protein [Teredinibacter waterburyi]|uniref:hypothetical protein n=1 Tax=Teredinibacter waterburyi TaxID=1500538 RepID=UPI00165FC49F|nr:hypothetical protein [Teredinibacter waterburyi]
MRTFALVLLAIAGFGCSSGDGTTPPAEPTAVPTNTPIPTAPPTPIPRVNDVVISGTITYDYVPHSTSGALDYDAAEARPARNITVVLEDQGGEIVDRSVTDVNGNYQLSSPENTVVRVVAQAEIAEYDGPIWQLRIVDNTAAYALYGLAGSLVNSGSSASVRNLHASSGWDAGEQAYTAPRSAAPFAILDSIEEALALIRGVDTTVTMPLLEVGWSENNIPVDGDLTLGEIGTSAYYPENARIYILGSDGGDTDEYDRTVILHEFQHYLEAAISRSDNIGGSHSLQDSLDMRVAFGEGYANAFAGLFAGTSVYQDSYGPGQTRGFSINLESNINRNKGWFNELAITEVVYDMFDSTNEGTDSLSLGTYYLYQSITSDFYYDSSAFTSIYVFAESLKQLTGPVIDAEIDALLESQQIYGKGIYGEGESNDGGDSDALPIYRSLSLNVASEVCTNKTFGEYNGLDVMRLLRIDIPAAAEYKLTLSRVSGLTDSDPDLLISKQGAIIRYLSSVELNREVGVIPLTEGEHIIEVFEAANIDDDEATGGAVCMSLLVELN